MFDLLIRNVRIVDGTGSPWTVGDVAVKDEKIAAVGACLKGEAKEYIDATNLTLAPGFIDIHSHSDFSLMVDSSAASRLLQGVTTELGGNCGISPAPLNQERVDLLREYTAFLGAGIPFNWTNFSEYLNELEKRRPALNIGVLAGHGTLRIAAMGFADRKPSPGEMNEMLRLLDESMQAGAFGLSTGLIYAPGCYADTEELVEITKVAAPYGGLYATHMRNEGDLLLQSVEEAATIGQQAGTRVQISHHKAVGRHNWGKGKASQALIAYFREQGLDIANDQYPYTASATTITTIFPEWAHEGGVEGLLGRLADSAGRTQVREAVLDSMQKRDARFSDIIIAEVSNKENKSFEGMSVSEAAASVGQEPIDFVIDLVLAEHAAVSAVTFGMCEADVKAIMQDPLTMIGSDGASLPLDCPGSPHPRNFSTFTRVLSKYVEAGLFSFEEGIRKMTSLPASRIGLSDRGLIKPGFAADLVLLDTNQLSDNATFKDPKKPPSGITKVWVNGHLAVSSGHLTGTRAGQVLRKL